MQEHLWVTNANKAFETMKLSLQYHAQEGKELQVVHFRQPKTGASIRMLNPIMLFIIYLENRLTEIKTDVLFCFSLIDYIFKYISVQRNTNV